MLRFWRSVELFAAPALKRPDPRERRYEVGDGQRLPWQEGHPLEQELVPPGLVWRHTVYGGVFRLDRLYETLDAVFGSSGTEIGERPPRGESALFAVLVTGDGEMLVDSAVLSTAAWAVGRARRPGPGEAGWLDGFDAAEEQHSRDVWGLTEVDHVDTDVKGTTADGGTHEVQVAVSAPVTHGELRKLVEQTAERLGVADLLEPSRIRVHSELVGWRRRYELRIDFLNSFFIDDLQKIAKRVASGSCGPALAGYLTAEGDLGRTARLDVRDEAAYDRIVERGLAPALVPVGRWPAAAAQPLATSQQLAINTIMARLGESAGVFGVNGPPGTGKTTMLRDLVAAVVVARARRLADLSTPAAAFTDEVPSWRIDKYQRKVRPPRSELTGFEMVVASANNTAVTNITREIPQPRSIDDTWAEQARYLTEHASRLLGAPAWGLVAAVLGNKENRDEFVSRFWYSRTDKTRNPNVKIPGFLDWLKHCETTATATGWTRAVAAFRAALAEEQRLRKTRQAVHEALCRLPEAERNHAAAATEVQAATGDRDRVYATAQAADHAAAVAHHAAEHARQRRAGHRAVKPGVVEMLLTLGRAVRRWHSEDEPLVAAVAVAEANAAAAATAAGHARWAVSQASTRLDTATAALERADQTLAHIRSVLVAADRQWPARVPDVAWRADERGRELTGPWLDEEWNSARTRVFLAALDLHAAFIAGAASILRSNLQAVVDILTGQAPTEAPEPAVRAAWQSLFLVVPVISTTFASVDRLLGRLGREALGWLFVDEAGQATPQLAAGAIWRARRVVAVGDPLQLEPVVTVPYTTQQALCRHHDVADTWLPGCSCVQALADRITPIGTFLPGPNDTRVWVGAPLRVHRRCDNPMFEVVNTAVYAGLMIHAAPARPSPLTVVDSAWIDVTGPAKGNWVPDEGIAAARILAYLAGESIDPADIMAISPFQDTARNLRRLASQYPGLSCGTVHIAQGKEAEIVLLVLGGSCDNRGARRWAATRPNLFNVAVSRAKQRLYVIGNHDSWAKLRYFSVLAETLPVRPLKEPSQT
ncbi:MAG TPA: DEAD/DEAH box helicase [Micromonosporaceae bacterium]|nr:DEAD/DEAH box helicase [Micromonosporaceae bacterium]